MQNALSQLVHRLAQSRQATAWQRSGLTPSELAQSASTPDPLTIATGPQQRAGWQRIIAAVVAFTLWAGPLQVSWQNAVQSAAQLGISRELQQARNAAIDWQFFTGQLKQALQQARHDGDWQPLQATLERQLPGIGKLILAKAAASLPTIHLGPASALAAPITDPTAPIRFQPQVTQTTGAGGGIPVVNITAPNANGISLNQYRQFNVDAIGLILNNSTTGGGSLLGGNVGANNALGGRSANQIINQVTSQGRASQINGSIEVFGNKADVIIANPNGVTCTGCGFINTPHITLTTGTPQFLSAAGGSASSFDAASAVAYQVQGGHIQIEGLPGAGGIPGAGIEGTVGAIDLIAGSIGINAPLYAGQKITLISGQQQVAQAAAGQGRIGSDYSTSGIQNNGAGTLQIDATAFGAMTAGQIKIIGSSAGLGVRTDGNLAASTGALTIDANGELTVGATYARQNVTLNAAGNLAANGDGLGEQGYRINAGGDVKLAGTLQSGQDLIVNAGGSINGNGGAVAQNQLEMNAGGSLDIGGKLQSGNSIALQAAGNDGRGDIHLGGNVSAPNLIQLQPARDITIDGNVTSGTALTLAAQRNLSIRGQVGSVGDLALAGINGSVTTTGAVVTLGKLDVNAVNDVSLGGNVNAAQATTLKSQSGSVSVNGALSTQQQLAINAANQISIAGSSTSGGDTSLHAASGDIAVNGDLISHGQAALDAGRDIAGSGNLSVAGDAALSAQRDTAIAGGIQTGGKLAITAARNLGIAQTTTVGATTLAAASGNLNINGSVASGGQLNATAGTDLSVAGSAKSLQDIALTAKGGKLSVQGDVATNGKLALQAAQTLQTAGKLNAASDATLSAQNLTVGGSTNVGGNLIAQAQQNLNASNGNLTVAGNASLTSNSGDVQLGSSVVGGKLNAQAANNLSAAAATVMGATTLSATNGQLNLNGALISGGPLNASAGTDLSVTGSAKSLQDIALIAKGGKLSVQGDVATNGKMNAQAAQALQLAGNLNSSGDSTLSAQTITTGGALQVGGNLNAQAQQNLDTSAGKLTVVGNATLASSGNLQLGSSEVGGNLNASAANNLSAGQITTLGNTTLNATNGSLNLNSALLSGAQLTATAGTDLNVVGNAQSLQDMTLSAKNGSLRAPGALATNGKLNLQAGQALQLAGQLNAAADTTLTAQTIALSGATHVGGNLNAQAQQSLDASSGTLSVVGNTLLASSNGDVQLGNSTIGGNLNATAHNNLSTSTAGRIKGDASLSAGNTLSNSGNWVAGGNLNANAAQMQNQSAAQLLSFGTLAVNADTLNNAGTLYGSNANITARNSLNNSNGSLLATNTLSVSTAALTANQNGVLYAGDSGARAAGAAPSGNLILNVSGGNGSLNNAGGQILAGNDLTFNLPNQVFDPSAVNNGSFKLNGKLSVNAQGLNVGGVWDVSGNALALNISGDFTNTGTIRKSGDISLTTGGNFNNSGSVIAGNDLTLTAANISNQAGGVLHAERDTHLNGNVVNAGTVEAMRDVIATGGNYDNRGATTQANRDIAFQLGGTLSNSAGVIGATRDINVAAAMVNNDRSAPVDLQNSVTTVRNDGLLSQAVVGTKQILTHGACNFDGCAPDYYVSSSATLADLGPSLNAGNINIVNGFQSIPDNTAVGAHLGAVWHFVGPNYVSPTPMGGGPAVPPPTIALPSVQRTEQSQQQGKQGLITAGGQVAIMAANLSNRGSTIAGNDLTLNLQALDNGRSDTVIASRVTEIVNQTELNNFILGLNGLGKSVIGAVTGGPKDCPNSNCPDWIPPNWFDPAAAATAPSTVSQTNTLGARGQLIATHDVKLSGSGNLVNAGDITAGNNIGITVPGSFTNLGTYESSFTTTAGCMPGTQCNYSNFFNIVGGGGYVEPNAHVDSFAFNQSANTVAAGGKLTINAGSINNNYGTLAARSDLNLTAGSLANLAGALQSTAGDVNIAAASVVNQVATPVKTHESYGRNNPSFAGGCNGGGDYKESHCAADSDRAASAAAVISGARDVIIKGSTLTNTGGLITAGRNTSVNATGGVSNTSLALNTNWYGHWVEQTAEGHSDIRHDTNGSVVIGNQAAGIQAGNQLSVVSGGSVINSGNLLGNSVDLSGTALVNGITNPQQPTPPAALAQQVIPLGPVGTPPLQPTVAQPQAPTAPSTVGQHLAPVDVTATVVQTGSAPTVAATVSRPSIDSQHEIKPGQVSPPPAVNTDKGQWHFTAAIPDGQTATPAPTSQQGAQYVVTTPGGNVLGGLSPNVLLANLPPALQPHSANFYYDPVTENQRLQQAALAQTGQASFINGLAWDDKNHLSIDDQQKAILYGNAVDYAKNHQLQLGQALSQQQINALTRPMLWYVEQSVPDPHCSLSSTACPNITALMPQVYLPQGYAATTPGGFISGNDVKLDFSDSIHNTGVVQANTLTVNTGTLTNEQRSVDIGRSAYAVQGGWMEYTGTQLQPGGFMSAVNLNLQANRINSIGDALHIVNADGSENTAATQAALADLKNRLGGDFTRTAAEDHIHSHFIKDTSGLGAIGTVIAIVAAVAISILTMGAGLAIVGAVTGMTTIAAGSVAAIVAASIQAAIVGTLSSMVTQVVTTGRLDVGQALESGAVSGLTAGVTYGVMGGAPGTEAAGGSTAGAASSAGDSARTVVPATNGMQQVSQGSWDTFMANPGTYAANTAIRSGISAAINTAAYGGSFGAAFRNGMVSDAAAVAANGIGEKFDITAKGADASTNAANIASHAVLGCAAATLGGKDCVSGAIGGATSAAIAPVIGSALGIQTNADRADRFNAATVTALATLAGGSLAVALGRDGAVAADAAANEATNNYLSQKRVGGKSSEQEQFDAANKNCGPDHLGDCKTARALGQLSDTRDANLNFACADRASKMCGDVVRMVQATGNSVIFGSNGQVYTYPTGSPTLQALPDVRQGTFQWDQGDNLLGAVGYTLLDSAAGAIGRGAIAGAKAIIGVGERLFGGATKAGTEVSIAGPVSSINNAELLGPDGSVLLRQNPVTKAYEPVVPGLSGSGVRGSTNLGSAADNIYSGMRPMEEVFPELKGVNPHYVENAGAGVNTNCVSCVNATQQRLTGLNPAAVADPSKGYGKFNDLLPSAPFGFEREAMNSAAVEAEMLQRGSGAVSPVVIQQPGGVMHVVNVVNRNGQVYFVDPQMGSIVTIRQNVPLFLGRP
ncbi:filamentous hemagglutinin N-terminal domain-containing protein [Paraherbaspirillum soli]|uniref:Filamentous hemagglutinin N-terminal domain-containing protein n=1 Tax=Paraherbaspirillum soli TaxID=631222 RepID=A0ABW0MCK6_9BURK